MGLESGRATLGAQEEADVEAEAEAEAIGQRECCTHSCLIFLSG